jgi:hypothetical protein
MGQGTRRGAKMASISILQITRSGGRSPIFIHTTSLSIIARHGRRRRRPPALESAGPAESATGFGQEVVDQDRSVGLSIAEIHDTVSVAEEKMP